MAKYVEQNISENRFSSSSSSSKSSSSKRTNKTAKPGKTHHRPTAPAAPGGSGAAAAASRTGTGIGTFAGDGGHGIHFTPLDWETDEVTPALTGGRQRSFDVVVACDCIYNEALVDPLVSTCADVCRLRLLEISEDELEASTSPGPCVCVIAQQLRDDQVFEAWMTRFCESFQAWRVPDHLLTEGLRSGSGFVVHMGILK